MNENQMLTTFSDEFVKFRESFHNAMNDVMDFEMTNGLYETQERSSKRLAELDKLIDEKNDEVSQAINLPSDELNALTARNIELIKGYEQEKEVIIKDKKELEEQYEEKIEEFRVLFKKSIEEMKTALGFHIVNGQYVSMIDVLRANLTSKITLISYQLETLKAELNVTKGTENRKHIVEQMQSLFAERKKLENLSDNLDKFMNLFTSLENYYVNGEEYVNAFDLERYSETFEEIANAVVTNVDNTLISVNIIANEDGTYSLDMRCGNKICEPRPLIMADKFNKNTINQYLEGFASALALKTDLKYDDLVGSKVILKTDGVDLGRHEFKNVGEMAELVKEGKRDQVLASAGLSSSSPSHQTGNGTQTPQSGTGELQPNPASQTTGNGTQTPQSGTGELQPNPAPQTTGNGTQTPQSGTGETQSTSEEQQPIQEELQQSTLPELDAHAMKVNSKRNARSKFYNKLKGTALVAAVGLGLAGPALGIGMIGAFVAGGIGVAGVAREAYVKLKENIKYGARRHKMKKLAKEMSKEAGVNIEFVMDTETRKAGFKLEGDEQFLTTDDLRDPNLFPEGMDDAIVDIFDNGVERLNKYRGKGEGAKTLKENRFKNFPRITFDNVSAAFNDFGGVKSWKELNDYQFDYNKIIQARQEEQEEENLANGNDRIGVVNPEELEDMVSALEEQQQLQNPGEPQPVPGQPQPVQQQGNGQQSTGPDNGQQHNPAPQPTPVVVGPLGPSQLDATATQIQFPQDEQDQLKGELTDWIRSEVQDPTNGIEVADKLEEAINGRKDELSEQSKIDLVNLFHDEVKFTEGQMEKFDFICRHDRTLTDFEVKEAIAQLEQVRATQGESGLGMAVSSFLREHSNLTKEDLEALNQFDTSKNMGFEEAINSKFNGQGPTM